MGLFESKKSKEKKSHLKNLLIMAMADGNLDKNEADLIFVLAKKYNFSVKEINAVKDNPQKVKFVPPKNINERFEQLFDLVLLMLSDGEIEENELKFCVILAINLGFDSKIVPELVSKIVEGIKGGNNKKQIKINMKDLLKD
jgi:uncharacterized tellurite resistance protein B-like protein